jgi:hypothetical protein
MTNPQLRKQLAGVHSPRRLAPGSMPGGSLCTQSDLINSNTTSETRMDLRWLRKRENVSSMDLEQWM